jgi:acylphosphatase
MNLKRNVVSQLDTDKTLASALDRPTYRLMGVIAAEVLAAKNVPPGAIGTGIEAQRRPLPVHARRSVTPTGTEGERMRTAGYLVALLLAAILASGSALLIAGAASAQQQAITATVTGAKIQKVGFRAMIQKEAIMYNLAGSARNNPDGTVTVSLQGDKDRIDQALAAIRAGSKKSSQNNTITQVPAAWDPNLKTFTVFAWTSTSRNIMNPYDLVFSLRPANDQLSHHDAKAIWNNIAKSTLKGDDLAKFLKHLDDDDY